MPLVSKPYNYNNGQTIDATQLDQNLDTLYNLINGLLDAVNIAAAGLNDPNKFAAEVITQAKSKGLVYTQDLYGQSWVVSGGVTTASGSPANQITVTTLIANILQADGSYRHVTVAGTTYTTNIINATYFLELQPDGTMNWSQTHSVQANYMPIATVTSNASGNINVITDNRVTAPKLTGSVDLTTVQTITGAKTFAAVTANSLLVPTDAAGGSYAIKLGRSGVGSTKAYFGAIGTNVGFEFDYQDAGGTGQVGFSINPDGTLTRSVSAYPIWDSGNLGAGLFANSKAAQGYQKLPGGLVIQWGRIAAPANAATPITNFPIPFPSVCVSLVGTHTQNGQTCNIYSKSLTAYAFYCTGADGTGAIEWQAIGY